MFVGRVWRKKRQVPLPTLRVVPIPQPSRMSSQWRPPVHNVQGLERNWYESFFRGHACFCGCGDAVTHINHLAARFGRPPTTSTPRGPQTPSVTPFPALPAPEPTPEPWRGAGGDGGRGGDAGGAVGGEEDAGDPDDAALIDAVDLAE